MRLLDSMMNGEGSTVFISGEAGSGKTRLSKEFLEAARNKGVAILTGWCLSNAPIPYFPFIYAFESYLSQDENDKKFQFSKQLSLKTLLAKPNRSESIHQEGGLSQVWKDQRFAAVTQSLLYLSSERPLLLFIDDLHWADSASLSLLHYIARLIESERILILATFRSEEIARTVEGSVPPLLNTLRLMGREDLYNEVKLPNLSLPNTEKVAESLLRSPVDKALLAKIFGESQGNPLFIIESLRMLFENESLIQDNGIWRLTTSKLGIPTKVRDIILRRLSVLQPNQRRILEVASVIGDKFDPQLIGSVLNIDSLEALEVLNGIALSKSLVCVEGDYYRFDHAKSREVLYEEILPPLKKGYHLRIAEKLEKINEEQNKYSHNDLAYHYTQAGETAKSIRYNLLAGKDALQRFSNAEAINHFRHVVENVDNISDVSDKKAEALEGLGDALYATGLFQEAIKTYETILSNRIEAPEIRKLRASRKAIESCYWLGNSKHALELADKAEGFANVDRLEYARLQLFAGFVMGRSLGNLVTAIKDMSTSVTVFQEEYSLPDIANGLSEISFIYSLQGNAEESLSSALRSVALHEELNDQRQHAFAIGRLGTALGTCGFLKEALEAFNRANLIAEKVGDFNLIAFHLMMSGLYLEYLNNNDAALTHSLEGLKAAEKTDARYIKLICHSNLVREYARIGEMIRAEEHYKILQNLFQSDPLLSSNINVIYNIETSNVVLLCCKKQWDIACGIIEKNLKPERIEMRQSYVRILQALGRVKEAQIQIEIIEQIEKKYASKFNRCNVRGCLLVNRHAFVNEEIILRLDIVNIGGKIGKLKRVSQLFPFVLKVSSLPPFLRLENGSLEMGNRELLPLHDEVIKLAITPMEAGTYNIKPKIVYIDETGKKRVVSLEPVELIVENRKSTVPIENRLMERIEFKSESAAKIFHFLVKSLNEDSLKKFPRERSGWRTLMDVVKETKVSKHAVYDSAVKRGYAIAELERSELIEAKVFTGERGRGGNIVKVRVAYEKEPVLRYIEQAKK